MCKGTDRLPYESAVKQVAYEGNKIPFEQTWQTAVVRRSVGFRDATE